MSKVKVKCAYKHNIVHKHLLKDNIKQLKNIACVFAILFVIAANSDINMILPTKSLYNDSNNVRFVYNAAKELKLIVPAKCSKLEVFDGRIYMHIADNIMLVSPENGVVIDVGELNSGGKYLKLNLCNNISCTIENIDVLGVSVGDVVKKGKDIATLYKDSTATMCIYDNNTQIKNIEVVKNIISWTN